MAAQPDSTEAKLARLELSEPDLARMQQQLSAILDYVELLNTLNTDGVEPLAHPLPLTNVTRPDEPHVSLDPHEARAGAPASEQQRFRVPRILDEEA